MGFDDKVKNAAQDLGGKAKEAAGKVTDNERLQAEGQADQVEANVNKAGENVKDAFK
ncbi:MAG: CsbD family protein [Microbacterium sp.]|uniref:CsbD family protein n=1 Tax=Microbacterium sp. TaxID=51671 RepID=UPI0019A6839A|nr:CsbD family protein [Microbacterium sp.]MBD3757886.1 CsbD family protein [Microbacterium sp.]